VATRAWRKVEFRKRAGRIESAQDLMKIEGIDGAMVESLKREMASA
jgi:DNA uptake protein ComE-like DNA-binding protein